jgi:hypothetical protein
MLTRKTNVKLKPIAWSHVAASVCVGFDCTTKKSKIYFCMYIPMGMSDIKKNAW